MKLVRDTRTLKGKAIASMRNAMSAFNSFDDQGRICSVLLHLQHACEMLLKAALVQGKVRVFDKETGKSIGFEKCLRLCQADHGLAVPEAGVMRAVDAMRDAAQHWFVFVSEDILYMQTRAAITAFDAYLKRALDSDLSTHIPMRVLPVSTKPPGDFEFLVDKEYALVMELLQPKKRKRDEARARIRSMLALEALVTDGVEISENDIDRIEKAMRAGKEVGQVFPRLITVSTQTTGEGVTLKVHFTKKEGAPVRYVGGDDPTEAAAVRDVDLRKKFHMGPAALATALSLTEPKSKALRWRLGIDDDKDCRHEFEFDASRFPRYSDNARNKMRRALDDGIDMQEVWASFKARDRRATAELQG